MVLEGGERLSVERGAMAKVEVEDGDKCLYKLG